MPPLASRVLTQVSCWAISTEQRRCLGWPQFSASARQLGCPATHWEAGWAASWDGTDRHATTSYLPKSLLLMDECCALAQMKTRTYSGESEAVAVTSESLHPLSTVCIPSVGLWLAFCSTRCPRQERHCGFSPT